MSGPTTTLTDQPARKESPSFLDRWGTTLSAGIIIVAAIAAFHNSFSVPFIFDDVDAIPGNPTIQHLWPIRDALSPPHGRGLTVEGRPVLNLSLAVNYAMGGTRVWGYHAMNLIIHILAALVLFGIVRRTLLRPVLRGRFGASATPLAFAVALVWTVHPLVTEPVTYVVQRAESLMGLFYLLTLYAVIRGAESPVPARWYAASVATCLLGMATKEVMVSAPLMVFLYDRMFLAGSFRGAWKKRWPWYAGLACTWLVLGQLVLASGNRGGTAGFQSKVTPWEYALTQCWAVVRYLRLSVWPHPLVFDYGMYLIKSAAVAAPYALILMVLAVGTVIALWRGRAVGFLGAWFFMILAPSSSVVPVATQTVAEHRMYLPLAAVVALAVMGTYSLLGRRVLVAFLALAVGFGFMSWRRNKDYSSEQALWNDILKKLPNNARAHSNLGAILAENGQASEAMPHYERALLLQPDYVDAHYNMGIALTKLDRVPEAIAQYEEALRLSPDYSKAHNNLGVLLEKVGRMPEAVAQYKEALRLQPDYPQAHFNLGKCLVKMGRPREAIDEFEQALRINPDQAEARENLANVLNDMGRLTEAMSHYEEVLRNRPDYAEAHYNLGNLLLKQGQPDEAMRHYQQALRIDPKYADAHYSAGIVLFQKGQADEAQAQFEEALRINPDHAEAHNNLGNILLDEGRVSEALQQYQEAVRAKPEYARAHYNLGRALTLARRVQEAKSQYEEALRLKPDYEDARNNLAALQSASPGAGTK